MSNILTVQLTANIDLDTGTLITISGLVRSGSVPQSAPTLLPGLSTFAFLGVQEWSNTTGTLVLSVLESARLEPATMIAGTQYSIRMQVEMPSRPDKSMSTRSFSAQASLPASLPSSSLWTCSGRTPTSISPSDVCVLPPIRQQGASVLNARETPTPSFVIRAISQQTCLPDACNTLTIAFSINRLIDSEREFYMVVSGLRGMHVCSSCLPTGGTCNSNNSHIFESTKFEALPLSGASFENHGDLFQSLGGRISEASFHTPSSSLVMRLSSTATLEPVRCVYFIYFFLSDLLAEVASESLCFAVQDVFCFFYAQERH